MVKSLQHTQMTIDERLEADAGFQLFKGSAAFAASEADAAVGTGSARKRRPAPAFPGDDAVASASDEDGDEDEDEDEDEDDRDAEDDENATAAGFVGSYAATRKVDNFSGNEFARKLMQKGSNPAPDSAVSDGSSDEEDGNSSDDGGGNDGRWKRHMQDLVQSQRKKRVDLMALVYGEDNNMTTVEADGGANSDSDDDDDIFQPVNAKTEKRDGIEDTAAPDCSKFVMDDDDLAAWQEEDIRETIRNRFVTGDWGKSLASEDPGQEEDTAVGTADDDEVYGDFEDLETGEKFEGNSADSLKDSRAGTAAGASNSPALGVDTDDPHAEDRRRAKAAKLAAQLDMALDGDSDATDKKGLDAGNEDDEEDGAYHRGLQAKVEEVAERNRHEFAEASDALRENLEGFKPGTYIRIEIEGVPAELIRNHDPRTPMICGMLKPEEEALGFIQLRLKRHRWHQKILKTNDPLVFSVGWRRFQSLPLYTMQDQQGRYRQIKYTPEHMHCIAICYGPITPPNTGIIAFQTTRNDRSGFRVSATGVITELDHSFQVVKKLKLVGYPHKVCTILSRLNVQAHEYCL
eukprot:SAG31_NODE_87_length_26728_cov_40.161591_24_plen_575_part_00